MRKLRDRNGHIELRPESIGLPSQRRGPLLLIWLCNGLILASGQGQPSYSIIKSLVELGSEPTALLEGKDHCLYGTMSFGGSRWEGVVFKLNRDGTGYQSLHSFTGYRDGEDGSWPQGVVEGSDGFLYGTTQVGGRPFGVEYPTGAGTVFKLKLDGSGYAVLHRFPATNEDGISPWGGLSKGRDGNLYGTTLEGGSNHLGVVFKLNPDGTGYQILHHFLGSETDGARPMSAVLVASDGFLYGTTDGGGSGNGRNGTLFKLKPDGSEYRVLHSFPAFPTDGRFPRSVLIEGRDGVLYGTTQNGGTNDAGTVFRITRDGTEYKILHTLTGFLGSKPDSHGRIEGVLNGVPTRFSDTGEGSNPRGLVQAPDGALYGLIENLGRNGGGGVFRLNTDGTGFTLLHSFPDSDIDGKNPGASLVAGSDGALYGGTKQAATNHFATLFKISIHSPPSLQAPAR